MVALALSQWFPQGKMRGKEIDYLGRNIYTFLCYFRDLSTFEFFSPLTLLLVFYLLVMKKSQLHKRVLVAPLGAVVITIVFTPQAGNAIFVADMRYLSWLLPFCILWTE